MNDDWMGERGGVGGVKGNRRKRDERNGAASERKTVRKTVGEKEKYRGGV